MLVVFSGSVKYSSQSQHPKPDPEYIGEFNVQCKDTAGAYREPQHNLE